MTVKTHSLFQNIKALLHVDMKNAWLKEVLCQVPFSEVARFESS